MARVKRLAVGIAVGTLLAQGPVIRVTTRLVAVNVIARDKDGPVRGLTKAEFSIVEKGKEHPIACFWMRAAAPTTPGAAVEKLPLSVFTNRLEQRAPGTANVTVVVLDGVNTQIRDQQFAKQQFLKFLRQIRREDRVAVYPLGSKLRVLSDFTNDAERLARVAGRYGGEALDIVEASQPDLADTGDDLMDDRLNQKLGRVRRRRRRDAGALHGGGAGNHRGHSYVRLPRGKYLAAQ